MQSQSLIKSWRARGGPYDGWEDLMYVDGVVLACSLGVGILRAWFSFACVPLIVSEAPRFQLPAAYM